MKFDTFNANYSEKGSVIRIGESAFKCIIRDTRSARAINLPILFVDDAIIYLRFPCQ